MSGEPIGEHDLALASSESTNQSIVSVLCAASNSVYKTIRGVDVYDAARDCRTFDGSSTVVAHPPCRAWSAFCGHQAKPDPGEKELGPWCVEQVRNCGGVLEHPAHSKLWQACNLPKPGEQPKNDLFTMWVSQAWWGDRRSKQTWLLVCGVEPKEVKVPFCLHDPRGDSAAWNSMSKSQRSATPKAMAEWLVALARLAKPTNKSIDACQRN